MKPWASLLRHVQNYGFKRALLQGFCVLGLTRIKHLGRIFVNNKALAALALCSGLLSATSALADQPHPWQVDLQAAATSLAAEARWFNHYTLWFIVPITLLVLVLLIGFGLVLRRSTTPDEAGYRANTRDFARLIWQTASPQWKFDEATFERSAASFENPDHVAIVIHNYRWRLGLAEGDPLYDDTERMLAAGPGIAVPTISLEGDANGAPHPDPRTYAKKFTGPYAHRTIRGGIGHNLPQEAPQAFAEAILDVSRT